MVVFGGHSLIYLFISSAGPIEAAKHAVQQIEKNPQQHNQTEAYYGRQQIIRYHILKEGVKIKLMLLELI